MLSVSLHAQLFPSVQKINNSNNRGKNKERTEEESASSVGCDERFANVVTVHTPSDGNKARQLVNSQIDPRTVVLIQNVSLWRNEELQFNIRR